jgi:ribosomal protein S27E
MATPGQDGDHQLKRIVLPSGKTIEVVYFDHGDLTEPRPRQAPPAKPTKDAERELHICVNCGSELVYPVQWEEAGVRSWNVTIRCPDCEWTEGGVFTQEQCDRFDDQLETGTDALSRDYKRLVTANMSEEIDRFAAALDADAILPIDF